MEQNYKEEGNDSNGLWLFSFHTISQNSPNSHNCAKLKHEQNEKTKYDKIGQKK